MNIRLTEQMIRERVNEQIVDALVGNMNGIGQITLCQTHWRQKFFQQHFTGMGWGTMGWNTDQIIDTR